MPIYEVTCSQCNKPKSPFLSQPPPPEWVCTWCAQAGWRKSHKSKWQHTPPRKIKLKPQPAKQVNVKLRKKRVDSGETLAVD